MRGGRASGLVLALLLALPLAGGCISRDTVTVTVVDDRGAPVRGAEVIVLYPTPHGHRQVSRTTGASGRVRTRGRHTYGYVDVVVRKAGHYESRVDDLETFTREGGRRIDIQPVVTIGLRPITHPIAMYARFDYATRIPVAGTPVGFDLIEGDWVAPYGEGLTADMLFTASGFWTSADEYSATLTLAFPNAGDGLVPFEAHPTSEFISPYEAPASGYQPGKTWRRSSRIVPGPGPRPGPWPATERVDEVSDRANYVFRVRTVRNPDGTIRSAHYGKLYGDPSFWPPREKGAGLGLTYYLNPTPNDRNLESDRRRGLVTGDRYRRP